MSGQRKYVWLLRHGERYDCTDAQWKATAKRPHDPHLSQAGIQQAYAAGRLIHARTAQQREAAELADVAIFTSPFLRCVQTAKSISTAYYDQLTGRPVSEARAARGGHSMQRVTPATADRPLSATPPPPLCASRRWTSTSKSRSSTA